MTQWRLISLRSVSKGVLHASGHAQEFFSLSIIKWNLEADQIAVLRSGDSSAWIFFERGKNRLTRIKTELGVHYEGLISLSFLSVFLEVRLEEMVAFTSSLLLESM